MQSALLVLSERARLFVHIQRSAETSHQPLEPPADYQGRWKENRTAKPPINGHLANSYRGRISPCFSHHTLSSRRHLPLILTTALPPLRVRPATGGFRNAWSIECWCFCDLPSRGVAPKKKHTHTNQARLVEWGFEWKLSEWRTSFMQKDAHKSPWFGLRCSSVISVDEPFRREAHKHTLLRVRLQIKKVRQQSRRHSTAGRNSVFHDVIKNEFPVFTVSQLSDVETIFQSSFTNALIWKWQFSNIPLLIKWIFHYDLCSHAAVCVFIITATRSRLCGWISLLFSCSSAKHAVMLPFVYPC